MPCSSWVMMMAAFLLNRQLDRMPVCSTVASQAGTGPFYMRGVC